jgi:hypothetical protein
MNPKYRLPIAIFIFFGIPILWALFLSATQSPKELQPWQEEVLRGANPRECTVESLEYYRCYHN